MYISLYVDVNTFIRGHQPQKKLMQLRTFKKKKKRSKGKGTRCPSCGECAKDCSCRRQISSLEDRVKELKNAAKEKKRDDDSKWKEMEQKLENVTNLVQNLRTTGVTGPAPTMASDPAPTSSAAPASTPLLVHTQVLLEILVFPLLDLQVLLGSIWVLKEENLRRRGLYCLLVLLTILMEKQGPP